MDFSQTGDEKVQTLRASTSAANAR